MNIKIKRFDKELPLPKHQTGGAAAFDLAASKTMEIAPHQVAYVPVNVAIATPEGHFLLLAARSSLHKRGLLLANGIGVGDPDFSGNEDQYVAALLNFTDAPVTVERGDRLMQGMFIAVTQFDWEEVDEMPNKTRGGFGTTGNK
jgi:dUTP pyrophosphatase